MTSRDKSLPLAERLASEARGREMEHLQAIEDNPLDAEQTAMFRMFEREGWSHERRREYLLARARQAGAAPHAAE